MWVAVYVATMAAALLACSVWAARKKERGVQAAFAGGAFLMALLMVPLVGGQPHGVKVAIALIVGKFFLVGISLFCHALVTAFYDE